MTTLIETPTITEEQATRLAEWMNESEVAAYSMVGISPEPPSKHSTRTGAVATWTLYVRAVAPASGPIYAVNSIGEMVPDPRGDE